MAKKKMGKHKKSGANLRYKNERRREKNHIKRISKHIARYGSSDNVAAEALKRYKQAVGVYV